MRRGFTKLFLHLHLRAIPLYTPNSLSTPDDIQLRYRLTDLALQRVIIRTHYRVSPSYRGLVILWTMEEYRFAINLELRKSEVVGRRHHNNAVTPVQSVMPFMIIR